jgi:hypothetical protein
MFSSSGNPGIMILFSSDWPEILEKLWFYYHILYNRGREASTLPGVTTYCTRQQEREKERPNRTRFLCLVTQQRTVSTLPEGNSEILPETLFRKLFMPVKDSNIVPTNFSTCHFFDIYIHLSGLFNIHKGLDSEEMGQQQRRKFVSVFLYVFSQL